MTTDHPSMERVVKAMRWRLMQSIGDRVDWDDLDELYLEIACDAGAFLIVMDHQEKQRGPLSPELAATYAQRHGLFVASLKALGIYADPRLN